MSKPLLGSLKARKGKKNKGKRVTRNVLTLAPQTQWWPLVPEREAAEVRNIFEEHLSVVHYAKVKVPWYILMKMTKEQRKAKLEEMKESLPSEEKQKSLIANRSRKYLTIGLNTSVRHIEQEKLLFCLIDSTEQPKILVDKLLKLSKEKQVLVGLMPNLKQTLKSIIGFPTAVLGFKKTVLEETCTIKGCLEIKNILDKLNLKPPIEKKFDIKLTQSDVILKQERFADVHLFRGSNKDRVFIPEVLSAVNSASDYIKVGFSLDNTQLHRKIFKRYTDQDKNDDPKQIFESPLIVTVQSNPKKLKNR